MSDGYCDDIRMYDDDPRSPFYNGGDDPDGYEDAPEPVCFCGEIEKNCECEDGFNER